MRLYAAGVPLLCSVLAFLSPLQAQTPPDFSVMAAARAGAATGFVVKGDAPGWLFLRDDVAHAGKKEFWKEAPSPAIPIIAKLRETLAAAGVALVIAPVPSKAAVYPDKFLAGAEAGAVPSPAPFLAQLEATGATVVDLHRLFREKAGAGTQVFCATDSHWSPAGAALAAEALAEAVARLPGMESLIKPETYVTAPPAELTITGDLAAAPEAGTIPAEKLTVVKVGTGEVAAPAPVPAAASSPVILMGDSHTMVFTDGATLGMHCQGAGLRDHLQARLGFPLIQLSNQNSGGTGARRLLSQRTQANPAYLKEVKVVVWVFSIREFTMGKWR